MQMFVVDRSPLDAAQANQSSKTQLGARSAKAGRAQQTTGGSMTKQQRRLNEIL